MKIMAVCGSGLGSSFMMEMNIKKVLKKLISPRTLSTLIWVPSHPTWPMFS